MEKISRILFSPDAIIENHLAKNAKNFVKDTVYFNGFHTNLGKI
jgi:hypothetical protein